MSETLASTRTALASALMVEEVRCSDALPLYAQPLWLQRFPWLFQATSGRGDQADFDLSFFTRTPAGQLFDRWQAVRLHTGTEAVAHARQVHGNRIIGHAPSAAGIAIHDAADGHVSNVPGLLLAVSVADCVPVSLVDARTRTIALLHAGWRGVASGILEHGLERMLALSAGRAGDVYCHLGPAICGRCYQVGPEVHQALGLPLPNGNTPVDLRALLAARALALGLPPAQVSISAFCTRCHSDLFFSHRAGHPERQMGLLAVRAP